MEMRADKTGEGGQIGPSKVPSHLQASRSVVKWIIMWNVRSLGTYANIFSATLLHNLLASRK